MSKAAELAALIGGQKALGSKNLIINGDMQVAQRGTSVAMAHDGNTSAYLIDRFKIPLGGTHEQLDGTYAQVADHPLSANGKSLKWTTGTAESSYDADEYVYLTQIIEAQNLQLLQYGNSNAQPITLSFYVKSSITGTFAVGLYKDDSTARIFNKTYTINSANTWEKKSVTFVGDTAAGGVIVNDNGRGFYLNWHLAAGSNFTGGGATSGWSDYSNDKWADGQATNAIMTTASATWQLAQCQLEIGEVATSFEHEDVGTTLRKCQRYYDQSSVSSGSGPWYLQVAQLGASYGRATIDFQVRMRSSPTVTVVNNNSSFSSSGVQLLSPSMASPYINSISDYNHLESWTASAEL